MALFFVTIGVLIDPPRGRDHLPLLGVLVGLVVIGKWAIWTVVSLIFREPLSTALLVGVGLTQIGEFSFILVQVARTAGHVGADVYSATLAASLVTILINAALVRWSRLDRSARSDQRRAPGRGPVDRASRATSSCAASAASAARSARRSRRSACRYVAIESDPDVVAGCAARAVPCLFGDAAQGAAGGAGMARALLVVVALPEGDRARPTVRRSPAPQSPRAHPGAGARCGDREGLEGAGATEMIEPKVEAAATLIRHALRELALPPDEVLDYLARFRGAMGAVTGGGPGGAVHPDHPLPEVREITLATGALADLTLGEARVRERFGVTVVSGGAAKRRDPLLNPSADTVLRARDRLRVFGLPEQIDAFRLETERAP